MPDGGTDSGTLPDATPTTCGMLSAVQVKTIMNSTNPLDPLGYPPFAADACALAYVTNDGTLVLRDLTLNIAMNIADASENPRRPTLAGGLLAWEATVGGKDIVRFRDKNGTIDAIPLGSFARAGEPRAAKDAIAFTAWKTADPNGDTDVLLFTVATKAIDAIGDGTAQQRFADIDATRIAFSDFGEGGPNGAFEPDMLPDGGYSPADIVVYDRAAKTKTVRARPGKQSFPMLVANDAVAYLDWSQVRPMPKLMEYGFFVGPVAGNPMDDAAVTPTIESASQYVRPSVHGAFFEWIANGTLWRRTVDLSAPVTKVTTFMTGAYGTVSTDSMVIAAVGTTTNVSLVGFDR